MNALIQSWFDHFMGVLRDFNNVAIVNIALRNMDANRAKNPADERDTGNQGG